MRIRPNFCTVNHFRQRCMKAQPATLIPRIIQIAFVLFARSGAPGETRTPGLLVRSKVVQNSKCCFWCRLQRNAPFISLLSWTEVDKISHSSVCPAHLQGIGGRGTERCPVKEITNPLAQKGYNRANFADNNLSCSLPFVGFPKRPRHEYADLSQFQLLANPGTTLPTGCLYHQRRCRSRRSRNCH